MASTDLDPAKASPAHTGPEVDFAMLLNQASYALGDRLSAALQAAGLSVREYCTLWKADGAGLTQRQLAAQAWMDEATLVSTLDALTERGLAVRQTAARDRRVRIVEVTDTGRTVVGHGHQAVRVVYEQLFADVASRDRDRFTAVLTHLVTGPLAQPFHMEQGPRRRAST